MKRIFLIISIISCAVMTLKGQDFAIDQLEGSPRHHEWVNLPSGDREVKGFVAYPQVAEKAPAIIVIHENRGLTDWVRSMADQLAAEGLIAFAPDLLSDFEPGIESTSSFLDSDKAREAIYQLDPEQVIQDLDEVFTYLKNLPASNGEVMVIGFCWGGSQSFRYAAENPDLKSAMVFYGTGPEDSEDYASIQTPVFGFYGENDQRVNATIPDSEKAMAENDKTFEYEIYSGAGHAYMRAGDDPQGTQENKEAKTKSMERIRKLLKGN